MEMTELTNNELRGVKEQLESKVEDNEDQKMSIENVKQLNKMLQAEKQVLSAKLEKLRKVTVKVPELQQELDMLR